MQQPLCQESYYSHHSYYGITAINRGVQNVKIFDMKLDLWVFPLQYTSGVITKNFSLLAYVEYPLWRPLLSKGCIKVKDMKN